MLKSKLNSRYLLLSALTVIAVVILEILSPVIVEYYSNNWQKKIKIKKNEIAGRIQSVIFDKEEIIFTLSSDIKKQISLNDPEEIHDFLEIINYLPLENENINIFKSSKLIGWNKNQIITIGELHDKQLKWGNEKSFFYETPLMVYLASISELDSIKIFTAIPLEKKYILKNSYYQKLSLTNSIEKEFEVSVLIDFNNSDSTGNSLAIKNSAGVKIGNVIINNISKDAEIQKIKEQVALLKSILILIAIIFTLIWFNKINFSKPYLSKIIYFIVSIIIVRISFSLMNIGDHFLFTDLINPIYFSSRVVFGLTKSPLELFLTIIAVFIISLKIFLTFRENLDFKNFSNLSKYFTIILLLFLFIIVYNGFASTLKSIIFDSSILYFKDASLFGGYQTSFMYFNILLVGVSALLFSIVFIVVLFSVGMQIKQISRYLLLGILFLLLLILILIDETLYNKSSHLFAVLFLIISFAVSYYWIYFNTGNYSKIITLLFASSILSISFLNYFNTELEITSLKTIANELTRSNIDLYEYYVDDALSKIDAEVELAEKMESQNVNLDAEAFVLWTKTLLPVEVQGSAIRFIDANKNLIGSFEYRFDKPFIWKWGDTIDIVKTKKRIEVFEHNSSSKIINAITPITKHDSIIGYLEISAIYDAYKIAVKNRDKLISSAHPIKRISVNTDLLKIYEFKNDTLSNYFTNIFLTKQEEDAIKNYSIHSDKEEWVNVNINNEEHIFCLKRNGGEDSKKIVAVGLGKKDLMWNLFDFFKVFFIHSIMILLFLFISFLFNYKNWKNIRISFRSKILIALLIVSIIPMIFLAIYFKKISDEKNNSAINYKLGKRADSVERYINNYMGSPSFDLQTIFDKTAKDLEINFSIYENENLIYSSEGTYYKIELLPLLLSPEAYLAINMYGIKEVILEESVDNYHFNSLYHKFAISDAGYIIKISDLFNNFRLPMSGIELNVFLFGTYSLAIIIIIILSTFLANQISAPIEKLTKATRSVSRGDMDIQLQNIGSGEVKELIDGFNLMVRELKKNQIELAEVERESAWREMAKQVAHEIKNPLTPMKLAVQHLVVAHKDKSKKYDSIFEKVTTTIINQIDTLQNIASEFSNIAKMPSIKLEDIDIVEIINETADLFIEENCAIKITSNANRIKIKSDKEQFQRMIINLIRNSIQARAKEIVISLYSYDDRVEIFIRDNGTGIKREVVSNIFDEEFTTKKDGMGLGLALTKRFLNQTGGKISVESTSEKGTTIKIEIRK